MQKKFAALLTALAAFHPNITPGQHRINLVLW